MATIVQEPRVADGFEWGVYLAPVNSLKFLSDVFPEPGQLSGEIHIVPVFQKTIEDMASYKASVEEEREKCGINVCEPII